MSLLDFTPTTWGDTPASSYERALWGVLTGNTVEAALHTANGGRIPLDVARFAGPPDDADAEVLDRCDGPTIDIGCGPGRMATALGHRGIPALGVDVVPTAVLLSRAAGATALCRSVFDRIPGEGRWHHALLMDGNIGIGGDPPALLARVKDLLAPRDATLIVEVELEEIDERTEVSLDVETPLVLTWASIGAEALRAVAEPMGYATLAVWSRNGRRFVELQTRPSP